MFAASPTFALMAWLSINDHHAMLCSSAPNVLPISGMAWMYVLMSLFHLSPWLRLISHRRHQVTYPATLTEGD